jgi:membrane protein required for colicin V production
VQAYDLIMLIVLGMSTIFGAIKGFAWQVASLASIIISYLVAYRFRFQVAEMIHATPPWNLFLAMLILYVGTSFVIWVGFRLLSGMIDQVKLKEFDRHLGAAFGLGKGLIYCLLITMFAMSLLGPRQQTAICQSKSGYYIASALDKGIGILPREIHDVVGPYLARLDEKLKDGRNGVPAGGNDPLWNNGLPSLPSGSNFELPGFGAQSAQQTGQGGFPATAGPSSGGWNLGGLLPNSVQNQDPNAQYPPYQYPSAAFGTGDQGSVPNVYPLPAANGFSGGYDGATQSAQQPGYVFPR